MKEIIRQSVSFRKEDFSLIKEKAEKDGNGFSNALRSIIREWAEMRKNFVTIPIKGAVVEGGKITIEEELARR